MNAGVIPWVDSVRRPWKGRGTLHSCTAWFEIRGFIATIELINVGVPLRGAVLRRFLCVVCLASFFWVKLRF